MISSCRAHFVPLFAAAGGSPVSPSGERGVRRGGKLVRAVADRSLYPQPGAGVGTGRLRRGIGAVEGSPARSWTKLRAFRAEMESNGADLLVVGTGVLGSLVAQRWLEEKHGGRVVGQTNTTGRHEELKSLGIEPVVKSDLDSTEKFRYVIFCAPPSGSTDYKEEVRVAAERWDGKGSLLFTSSSAVYDVNNNCACDEESAPIVPLGSGPRTDNLLNAEAEILKVGGNVVRLAGLYTFERGPHTFYLSKGTFEARPDQILNLIHYEDAASLCVAILKGDGRGKTYMGCDGHPLSRQEIMEIVNESGKFSKKFEKFTGVEGPLGKKMTNSPTRLATGWKPKYESFRSFLGVR